MRFVYFRKKVIQNAKKNTLLFQIPALQAQIFELLVFFELAHSRPKFVEFGVFCVLHRKMEMYQPGVQQNLYPGHEVCVFSKKVIQNAKKNTLLFKIPTIQAQIFELLCFLNFHIPGTNSLNLVFFAFYTKKWKCISPGYSKTYTLG